MTTLSRVAVAMVLAAAFSPTLQADENACSAQLESYLALNAAPTKGEIAGVNQVGLSADEVATLTQEKGACAAWNAVISDLMKQHGKVLDGVEQMTGKPAPVR